MSFTSGAFFSCTLLRTFKDTTFLFLKHFDEIFQTVDTELDELSTNAFPDTLAFSNDTCFLI